MEVKDTLLPFKGLGLFARKDICQGEIIGEYYGSMVSYEASESTIFNDEQKMMELLEGYCIIGRCPVSRINDIVDLRVFG